MILLECFLPGGSIFIEVNGTTLRTETQECKRMVISNIYECKRYNLIIDGLNLIIYDKKDDEVGSFECKKRKAY
jgi:hypothetical protein